MQSRADKLCLMLLERKKDYSEFFIEPFVSLYSFSGKRFATIPDAKSTISRPISVVMMGESGIFSAQFLL